MDLLSAIKLPPIAGRWALRHFGDIPSGHRIRLAGTGNNYCMEINFSAGEVQATFRRNHFTGRAVLDVSDDTDALQNVRNPCTHFSLSNQRDWQRRVNGHQIEIVKDRPMFLSAFRPHSYTVLVDSQVVAQKKGY